jgi:hypothetical protein
MEMEEDTELTVCTPELTRRGYACEATLLVQPGRGRWVATLWLIDGVLEREVAWEPSSPEEQRLAVEHALADPEAAIRQAIEVDCHRREGR